MNRRLCTASILAILAPIASASAQVTGRVSGTVTSAEGNLPLTGVRITVRGTAAVTTTNTQGRFTFVLPPGTYRITASAIGYTPAAVDSIPVSSGQTTPLDIQLKHSLVELDKIVVTGYGSQARRDVTGAIGSVDAREIHAIATNNTIDAIKGRIPGVDITASGYKPGDGVRVQVRGQRSIRASNDPLYVLDGVPMAGGVGDLNSSDIESIEVLKDASATAIYGSRGANGVVLVTSRKGIAGNNRISYDTYFGSSKPAVTIATFNGPEFAEYKREAYRAAGAYVCPGGTSVCDAADASTFYAQEIAGIKEGTSIDYRNLIQRRGSDVSHQVNVAGGNERTQYSVSANVVNTIGTILGEDFNRKSMRVNFESQASSRIRVGGSALVVRSNQNLGRGDDEYGLALQLSPLAVAFDSAGHAIFKPTPDPQVVNPVNEVGAYIEQNLRNRAFGALFTSIKLAEGLDYRVSFGPDLTFSRHGLFRGAQTQANQGSGADATRDNSQIYDYTLDNVVNYRHSLGVSHKVDATLLYSVEKNRTEVDSVSAQGLPYETQLFYNMGTGATITNIGSGLTEWALQSYMGRLNYTFRDRYLLTVTAREDGSSRLAEGRKYSLFPSAALGWRVFDEGLGDRFGPINSLKLRTSYGRTGNTSVSPYQTQGGLTRSTYAFGNNGAFGFRPGSLPNPNLQWEQTAQLDAGADFSLMNGRLAGALDVYRANTTHLLLNRQLSPTSGFTSITQNIGATRNTGLELSLTHLTVDGRRGLHWSNDFTFAMNKNQIVSLVDSTTADVVNRWFVGQPIDNNGTNRVWYDYKFVGVWQLADSLEARKFGQTPGQIRVLDRNGDYKINEADKMILGNNYPRWTGSWNTRADYKRLDIAMQVYMRQHFIESDGFINSNSTLAGRYNGIKVNYWTPTNPSNTDPRPNKNQEQPIYGGTRSYEDASFVKIRNINVGFIVPPTLAQRIGAQSLRIYGSVQNVARFTKFKGLDPEGRTSAGAPPNRSVIFGANFGF